MSDINIYDELGVKRIRNCAGTYTAKGGSRMERQTIEDMWEATNSFVDIRELQSKINLKIAEMTHNEAAYVCNCATAGVYFAIAAAAGIHCGCNFNHIPTDVVRNLEVVIFKAHRNQYDSPIKQLGLKYVEVGYPNALTYPTREDLLSAITPNTVAIYYLISEGDGWIPDGAMNLYDLVDCVKDLNIPIIADAASQLPPVENLWRYNNLGITATVFSGGKDIRGPQASGLITGKKYLIDEVAKIGYPNYGIGRMLKICRVEMVGLYCALKRYLKMDQMARLQWTESAVENIINEFKTSDLFNVERSFPNEAAQPIPRAKFTMKKDISKDEIVKKLLEHKNNIYVNENEVQKFYLNPMVMDEEYIEKAIEALHDIEKSI